MNSKIDTFIYYINHFKSLYIIKNNKIAIGLIYSLRNKREARINFIIKKQYRNKGYMKNALKRFLEIEMKSSRKIFANVNPNNLAAIKVLEKSNFKKVKVNYNSVFNLYTNKIDDEIIYLYNGC